MSSKEIKKTQRKSGLDEQGGRCTVKKRKERKATVKRNIICTNEEKDLEVTREPVKLDLKKAVNAAPTTSGSGNMLQIVLFRCEQV